jgi:flagellar hook capping protein FlgD
MKFVGRVNRSAWGARCTVAAFSALFVLLVACISGPALAETGLPPVFHGINWRVVPNPSCPDTVTAVRFLGCRCNVDFMGGELNAQGVVVLHARVQPLVVCIQCDLDSLDVPLGKLAPGQYNQAIQIVAEIVDTLGQTHTETGNFNASFFVGQTCQQFPGRILPFLDEVTIGRGAICRPACPQIACAGDSIPVHLAGTLPSSCQTIDDVRVVPSPVVGPEPQPEMIQITFGTTTCVGVACDRLVRPWEADVKLSQLPPMPYGLIVEEYLVDHCAGTTPVPNGQATLPFVVQACESIPPQACFDARFVQGVGMVCDAFIAPGQPAHVTFEIAPTVSLAGLQGAFRFNESGFKVSSIQTTGAASGMQLFWNPDLDGAHFVLYSDQGHLIPPQAPIWSEPWESILLLAIEKTTTSAGGDDVQVQDDGDRSVTDIVRLAAGDLLAADSSGHGVPQCLLVTDTREEAHDRAATLCPPGATSECDVNHDGHADVRDLVLMAMCIGGFGACPDTSGGVFDCDGNGVVDLADVMCCAHHILDQRHSGDGDDGDDDSHIAVEMAMPRPVTGGCDVPVTIHGMSTLGAARLDFSFPSDRYDVTGVDLPSAPGWLSLSQKGDGQIAVAWIAAGSAASQTDVQYATIHLRLKAGATDGGDLTVSGSQFASRTGGALKVSAAGLSLPLSGGRVALSAPLPNPAGGRTSFSVMLAQPGALDVGVFDAGGRRIATLFHGDAPAGARTLSWDGRRDSGVAAGSGLFFVRAESAGYRVTQKVMLLSPR